MKQISLNEHVERLTVRQNDTNDTMGNLSGIVRRDGAVDPEGFG